MKINLQRVLFGFLLLAGALSHSSFAVAIEPSEGLLRSAAQDCIDALHASGALPTFDLATDWLGACRRDCEPKIHHWYGVHINDALHDWNVCKANCLQLFLLNYGDLYNMCLLAAGFKPINWCV